MKHKLIITLVAASLPSSAMDENQKQEIMKNGQKYSEMLHLDTPEAKLQFMKNGGKFQEAIKANVYVDFQPVVVPKLSSSHEPSTESHADDEQQTVIKIKKERKKDFSAPTKNIKINLTPIHNSSGNIIINLYDTSSTYKRGTNDNDQENSEEND